MLRWSTAYVTFSSPRALMLAMVLIVGLAGDEADAAEGFRFEIEFLAKGSPVPVNRATVWSSERRIRVEQQVPGAKSAGPVFVYRGDADHLLSISDRTRRYARIERQLLSRVGSETKRARREVERQLKALPSDQRKAFERLLGVARQDPDMVDDPVVVERTSEQGEVAGFACTFARLARSDRRVGRACIVDWERIGMKPADLEVFRQLANFQRDAIGTRALTPMELVPNQPLDLITQFGGLPLSYRREVDGEERSAIRVVSVSYEAMADSLFEAPPGYALRSGPLEFARILQSSGVLGETGAQALPAALAPHAKSQRSATPSSSAASERAVAPSEPRSSAARQASRARMAAAGRHVGAGEIAASKRGRLRPGAVGSGQRVPRPSLRPIRLFPIPTESGRDR